MKKYKLIILYVVFSIIFATIGPNFSLAFETENEPHLTPFTEISENDIDTLEYPSEIENKVIKNNTITEIQTSLENENLYAQGNLFIDNINNEIQVEVYIKDVEQITQNKNYSIHLKEITEDILKMYLVDQESKEVIYFDSTQVKASVLPVAALATLLIRSGLSYIIKLFGKKALENTVKNLSGKIAKKSLGKGSTGRQVPKDLVEEIFMDHVLDNPLSGATELTNIKLTDNRWPHTEGWVKMERKLKTKEGRNVVIHFVYNKQTKKFDDFKFK